MKKKYTLYLCRAINIFEDYIEIHLKKNSF